MSDFELFLAGKILSVLAKGELPFGLLRECVGERYPMSQFIVALNWLLNKTVVVYQDKFFMIGKD